MTSLKPEAGNDGSAHAAVKGPFKQRKDKKSRRKKLKADRAILQAMVSLYWPGMKEWYDGVSTHVDPEDEALTVTSTRTERSSRTRQTSKGGSGR